MANVKISGLPEGDDNLSRDEVFPIVQNGDTVKIPIKHITKGGITITVGSEDGPIIPVDSVFASISTKSYNLTGWALWTNKPIGSMSISVRKCNFASLPPTSGDEISGTGKPNVSSTNVASSNDLSGWSSTSIQRTDAISIKIDTNDSITWFTLVLYGE